MIKKLLQALIALPHSLRRTPEPRLIMTLLVKNEEELLEQNLLYHKSMGVDGFIITDNNSTDRTPEIIEKYRQKGWVLNVIRETATDYAQKRWVDRMVLLARKQYKADWIINADADEFWYAPSGDLKALLATTHANALDCEVRNVLPEANRPWTAWDKTVRHVPDAAAYDLSLYSLYGRGTKKVMHRAAGYLQISMGNHKVKMLPKRTRSCDVVVYHYNVRSREAFVAKMVNGGQQLEQRKSRHGGRHWRYFYALYKEGRLEAEYDRVVGTQQLPRLIADGFIKDDNPLPAVFNKLNH